MTKTKLNMFRYDADDGMVLTDGETYSKTIFLAPNASIDDWREITQEEYDAILAEQEAEPPPE